MDYEEFIKITGEDMDVPTEEQTCSLIEGEDTMHLTVGIGYVLINGQYVRKDTVPQGEHFVHGLSLLQKRGAVRGQDYILTCYTRSGEPYLMMAIHTTHAFLSDEDFDPSIPRI